MVARNVATLPLQIAVEAVLIVIAGVKAGERVTKTESIALQFAEAGLVIVT